jgi:hypothetical protein
MKPKKYCSLVKLLFAWVFWTNAYGNIGWQPVKEFESLSECQAQKIDLERQWPGNVQGENDAGSKLNFIKRMMTPRVNNPNGEFKCLPMGATPAH